VWKRRLKVLEERYRGVEEEWCVWVRGEVRECMRECRWSWEADRKKVKGQLGVRTVEKERERGV